MKRIALTALLGAMFAAPVVSDAAPLDHWTTANGARVYYVPSHEIGMVDISVEFDAGSRHNPPGKSALAALVNAQLDKGIGALGNVPAMNEAELLDAFADAAAVRSCENGADSAGCSVRFLSDAKTRDTVVPLMAAVLAKPAFPSDVLARDKKRYESGIRESLSRVETVVSRAYKKAVYGDHPYGRSVDPDDVASVSASELADFHKRHYTADTAVVSIVGDISREDAVKAAETLTKDLPAANDSNVPLVPAPKTTAKSLDIFHDSEQSHVRIGLASLKRGDKDFFAVHVCNQVLGGGGFTSRLMKEIREKRAMSYHVGSVFSP
ncbi:MAG: insulinase family protein, partial [Thermoguttaceae bacterium]|nr:insulinase family protein [Thermoguttaceae bacterium]